MAETQDATDNIQSIPTPQVVPHDYIDAAPTYAGGDTPRLFPRQTLTGNARGVMQFGTPNLFADSGNNYFGVAKSNSTGTSINQVLMGLQPTFGEGFYVTKEGIDVTTAASADDFIFNSNQNIFKIVQIGTGAVSGVDNSAGVNWKAYGGGGHTSIVHGLSFIPSLLCYVTGTSTFFPNSYHLVPTPIAFLSSSAFPWVAYADANVDSTYVNFYFNVAPGANFASDSYNFKYYLLQEAAT